MPLTNAEKQRRHRQKRADKIAKYEAALRGIAGCESNHPNDVVAIARQALGDA